MTDLQLDLSSGVPLHRQVYDQIRQMINRGGYQAGHKLPGEAEIAQHLGISRNTVRQGIGRLVSEGLVERRAGDGTRVAYKTTDVGLGQWSSFSREMAAKGISVETFHQRVITEPAAPEVADGLQLDTHTPVVLLERVRGYDGKPAVWFRSWFHPRLQLSEHASFEGPLYAYLERTCAVVAEVSQERIAAVAADGRAVSMLAVEEGVPLLVRTRVVRDQTGRVIEFARNLYRSDRFTYSIEIKRSAR